MEVNTVPFISVYFFLLSLKEVLVSGTRSPQVWPSLLNREFGLHVGIISLANSSIENYECLVGS
jgi:hypothetical protein